MAGKLELKMPTLDDIFTTQEQRDSDARIKDRIMSIPLSEIVGFPNHPYKVENNEDMTELVESIKLRGLLHSALVRPNPDGEGYQMIAGHRRKMAFELAGINEIPCIIREMDDDEAVLAMVDSNLQRERILPSEKAFAYKMRLEALNHQGKRTDLTLCPVGTKLNSANDMSKDGGDSTRQIFRYIRLTEIIPERLDMVDENKVAFRPAVEL
ncbi:MAG: ParB/RepB/Spo0J family partition protein, partial [Oscillospiraceae bacterium]